MHNKIKGIPDLPDNVFLWSLLTLFGVGILLAVIFSLGETNHRGDLRILSIQPMSGVGEVAPNIAAPLAASFPGAYVGSKTGKAYYLPWCTGVKHIREANKIWFANKEEAETKGYKPAGNCKGI